MSVPGPVHRVAACGLVATVAGLGLGLGAAGAAPAAPAAPVAAKKAKGERASAAKKQRQASKRATARIQANLRKAVRDARAGTTTPVAVPAGPATIRVTADKALVTPGFRMTLDVSRPKDGPSTTTGSFGDFLGEALPGATFGDTTTELGFFAGPVRCLEASGRDATVFYPIQEAQPPLPADIAGVFVSVRDGGAGGQDMAGFLPVPMAAATECPVDPNVAMLPVTSGDITVSGG